MRSVCKFLRVNIAPDLQHLPKMPPSITLVPGAIRLGWRRFLRHHGFIRASAISFACMLAFLPFFVLLSSIAGALGYLDLVTRLIPLLETNMGIELPLDRIHIMLQRAQEMDFPSLGIVGSITLLVPFLSAMASLESNMNVVWGIRRGRPLLRKLSVYLPFLLLLVGFILSLGIFLMGLRNFLGQLALDSTLASASWFHNGSITLFLGGWVFLFIAILYFIVPNTKVQFLPAIWAALLTTGALWLFAKTTLWFQQYLFLRFSVVYGSLTLFPILMLAVYGGWIIILVGSGFSWGMQRKRKVTREQLSS